MAVLSFDVDSSLLTAAIEQRIKWMDRTVVEACVTSAYFVAARAKELTPVTDIATIDAELAVEVHPVIGKRGKPLKNKKTFTGGIGDSRTEGVPLAVLIVQARANPASNYNRITGGRWALAQSPFKGVKRAKGGKEMAKTISHMIAARHSSPHFLQIGWNPALRELKSNPNLIAKYRRGGPSTAATKYNRAKDTDLGGVVIELSKDDCKVTIENAIGDMGGAAEHHREALMEYGAPALQQAINEEAALMIDWIEKHSKEGDDRFNQMVA